MDACRADSLCSDRSNTPSGSRGGMSMDLQPFSILGIQTQRRGSAFFRGRRQGWEMKLRKGRLCRLRLPDYFSSNFSTAPSVSARADDLIDRLSRNTKRHARHRDWLLRFLSDGISRALTCKSSGTLHGCRGYDELHVKRPPKASRSVTTHH